MYKLILTCVYGKKDIVADDILEKGEGAVTPETKADSQSPVKKLLLCVIGK